MAKRDKPLAKRLANITAPDDQRPHSGTISLGQAMARTILDFAGHGLPRIFSAEHEPIEKVKGKTSLHPRER